MVKIKNDCIKLVALDLDGTLTQHKSKLDTLCRDTLYKISRRYKLVMVCAGGCERVYRQMEAFPVDIIGNYGMELSTIKDGKFVLAHSHTVKSNRLSVSERIEMLRGELGFTEYYGDSVEFHASGAVTFPILGTSAPLDEKLAYDPNREKRRSRYARVKEVFRDYTVFIGGSSSFDMAPPPYCKLHALDKYLEHNGLGRENVIFFGDDYGVGGNDEDVYKSEIRFVCIDDYRRFPEASRELLLKDGD